ncbi:MAG: pitrilysin family protein [Alphaproteobacteria bacterium]
MIKKIIIIFSIAIAGFIIFNSKEERILSTSVLKNYTFTPKVSEINDNESNISAYLFEDNSNPIVAIDIVFTGAGFAQNKITNILSQVLTDDKNLQEELEINGITIYFNSSLDSFGVSIITPKKSLSKAVDLFVEIFHTPNIKNSSIDKTKQQLLLSLKRQQEHPSSKLSLMFNKKLYGNHPYGDNPLGSEEEINNTTKLGLLKYLKSAFAKDNLIVSIAGDINQEEAKSIINTMFINLPEITKIKPLANAKLNKVDDFITEKNAQNISIFATNSPRRLSDDFYPLYLANYILGGSGLNSKLAKEIREKNGLVYSIYSYLSLNDKSNLILFSFSTSKENYQKALSLFEAEIKNLKISNSELSKAKQSLIASNNLRFANISEIAIFLTYMQKESLGLDFFAKRNDYINNVTTQQIKNVIKKYYNFNNFNQMTIGEK